MKSILCILSVLAFACTVAACPLTSAGVVTYAPAQQVQFAPVQLQQAPVSYAQAPSCALGAGGVQAQAFAYAPSAGFGAQRSFGVGYGASAAGFAPAFGVQRSVIVNRGFPASRAVIVNRGLFGGARVIVR